MPRQRYRKSDLDSGTGRQRLIPEYLRELIWEKYHEVLAGGRRRSILDVANWLDEHDIPTPKGGRYWPRSTVQTVLEDYRYQQRLKQQRDYDSLMAYEQKSDEQARKRA